MSKTSERIRAAAIYDGAARPAHSLVPLDLALQEVKALEAQLAKMRELIGAFSSGGDWGKWKAWLVEGSPIRADGIAAAALITRIQASVDAALAAEPAGEKEQDGKV